MIETTIYTDIYGTRFYSRELKEEKTRQRTIKDVFDSMTEEQKQVVYFMVDQALESDDKDEERLEQEAKMKKFEIGDTVQVVKADYEERQSAALSVCNHNLMANTGVIIAETDRDGDCFVRFSEQVRFVPAAWLKLVKKAEKYWTGKVVCIGNGPGSNFKTGKVYTINNGTIAAYYNGFALINGIKNVDDLNNKYTEAKFMEFKGFADEGKDKNE